MAVFVAVLVGQENAALGLFRTQVDGNNHLVVKHFELFNIAQFPQDNVLWVFVVGHYHMWHSIVLHSLSFRNDLIDLFTQVFKFAKACDPTNLVLVIGIINDGMPVRDVFCEAGDARLNEFQQLKFKQIVIVHR